MAAQAVAWGTVVVWALRVLPAMRGLKRVPDLCRLPADCSPEIAPLLTVVVPAKEEAAKIKATLRSLLGQDYPAMEIIAVNDRSQDATGALMEQVAAQAAGRIRVVHVAGLPDGWTGKVHAMQRGMAESRGQYVLFTDADVLFGREALRRAMTVVEHERADHLVVMPTPIVESWREGAMLGALQMLGALTVRPWKVADPKARRDAMGVGAFNLVRREAFAEIGGFLPMRMEVLEDVRLAFQFKRAGLRTRVAFGRGLVRIHWARGLRGIVGVVTKNLFAAMRFHAGMAVLSCAMLGVLCVLPAIELFWAPTRLAGAVTWGLVGLGYWRYGRYSGVGLRFVVLFPFGSAVMIFALARSTAVSLRQGGVLWRGTFYPLRELRAQMGLAPWH